LVSGDAETNAPKSPKKMEKVIKKRGFEGGEGFVLYGEKSCGMILWSFSLGGHPSGMDKL